MKNRIAANHVGEIEELKEKKNAIILAHYYQTSDIQDKLILLVIVLPFQKLLQIMPILFICRC